MKWLSAGSGKSQKEKQRLRLTRICRTIEEQAFFHGFSLERAFDIDSLKSIFHLHGLWVLDGKNGSAIYKSGSADYGRDLNTYCSLKKQYADLSFLEMQRSADFYYVVDRFGYTFVFSAPVQLTDNDIYIMLREVMRIQRAKNRHQGVASKPAEGGEGTAKNSAKLFTPEP